MFLRSSHFLRRTRMLAHLRLAHYGHSERRTEGCRDGGRDGGAQKPLRCSRPGRVAAFEKQPGGVLMQQVDGRMDGVTDGGMDGADRNPLSSFFSRGLFFSAASKRHIMHLMFEQTHLDAMWPTGRCMDGWTDGQNRGGERTRRRPCRLRGQQ